MDARTDTGRFQIVLQLLPILYPYHIKMIDCSGPRSARREAPDHLRAKQLSVDLGFVAALTVPL